MTSRSPGFDPILMLARTRFPRKAGVVVVGANDRVDKPRQRIRYLAARHAEMTVIFMDLPGGRNWQVWRGGLQHNVAWGQSAEHQGMGK